MSSDNISDPVSLASARDAGSHAYTRRVLIAVGITALAVILLWILQRSIDVVLLIFAGVLLAVFLRALVDGLKRVAPLSDRAAFASVILLLLVAISSFVWFNGAQLAQQTDLLIGSLSEATDEIRGWLSAYAWGQSLLAQIPDDLQSLSQNMDRIAASGDSLLSNITGVFSSSLNVVTNLFVILFVGLFLALDPGLYMRGLAHLAPHGRRERVYEVLRALEHSLRWWLVARIASMTIVGVATWIGLWFLGVPLPLLLGFLTGLLTFVPIVGAAAAVVPPLLLALTVSPQTALYVLGLYVVIQLLESNILTPLLQERATEIPPALLLFSQMLLGIFGGILGVAVATPLAATTMVLVKMLYVEDVLGEPMDVEMTSN